MNDALKNYAGVVKAARKATPQTQRTPGRTDEVRNNAGGFVFTVSDKSRLERFLILGTDGGTYYVGERTLTEQNAQFVIGLIARDEAMVRETLRDVAVNNRAAKNDPSIFTLALLMVHGDNKAATRGIVNDVVRTSTHLFDFTNYLKALGGMGRAKRAALAEWYTSKRPDQLAYQAVKYRQRNGVTHRDVFRIAHPVGVDSTVGNFILGKDADPEREGLSVIEGFNRMQRATSVKEVVSILGDYRNLPWETIPTQFLTDETVWKTLFYNGALGQTALLRNVTRFAKMGAFKDLVFAGDVAKALADAERIRKGRVHPVAYANALGIYQNGQLSRDGYYGNRRKDWDVNAKVLGGIEAGFYESFATVTPANKATMVSVDVSGSMTWGAPAGLVGMNYLEAAAVMAMVTVRTEPYVEVNAFSTNLRSVNVSDKDTLDKVVKKFSAISVGGTDVSQPMVHAKAKGLDIDGFVILTDNETWAGKIKPHQALKQYRESSGRDARVAVVAMAATPFTVADDSGHMLDFVGFDSAAPKVLADFLGHRL